VKPPVQRTSALKLIARQGVARASEQLQQVLDYLNVINKDPFDEDVDYELQQRKLLGVVGSLLEIRVLRYISEEKQVRAV